MHIRIIFAIFALVTNQLCIMAISRNNLSMKLTGRVGAYSYYTTTGGRQIARVAQNSSNYGESATRTEPQQNRRSKWGNLVNFYKLNKTFFRRAFESKSSNQSDYNKFMSVNLPKARVALTKNDYSLGGCVLDGFRVSEGSLRGITDSYKAGQLKSVIECSFTGALTSKTVGELSADLLAHNGFLMEGDQITYVYWRQFVTVDRVPRFYSEYFEITLDKSSTVPMSSLTNSDLVGAEDGFLFGEMDYEGALAAFVLTRQSQGSLQVSTETAILNSDLYLKQWTGEEAEKKAIASYGVDNTAMLEPGSPAQPKPKPIPEIATINVSAANGIMASFLMGEVGKSPQEVNTLSVKPGTQVQVIINSIPEHYEFERWSTGSTEQTLKFIAETSVDLVAFFKQSV